MAKTYKNLEDCASRIRNRVQITTDGLLRVCFQSYHRNKNGPSENGPKFFQMGIVSIAK